MPNLETLAVKTTFTKINSHSKSINKMLKTQTSVSSEINNNIGSDEKPDYSPVDGILHPPIQLRPTLYA